MCSQRIDLWDLPMVLNKMEVKPQLAKLLNLYLRKRKNEAIELFTNQVHYTIFKQLSNKPSSIYISRNYVVLAFRGEARYHYYVIGENSDGRLFINKIREFSGDTARLVYVFKDNYERKDDVEILIYLIDDVDVHRSMGFGYDLENSEDKAIPKYHEGYIIDAYRVQGDLCLRIFTENVYFETIRQLLAEHIRQILNRVILERIRDLLADLGISSEFAERFGFEVIAFRVFPRDITYEEERYYLNNLFAIMKRKLNVSDIADSIAFTESFNISDFDDKIIVQMFGERAPFGQRFKPTICRIWLSREVINDFVDRIMNDLQLECSDRVISRGRHLLRYFGLPSRFTIIAKLPSANMAEEEYVIPVNMNILHIAKGKVYLYHPEHGSTEINIMQNLAAEVFNVWLDDDFEERLNYFAIKSLPDSRQLSLL